MVFDDEPIVIESVKHIVNNEMRNIRVTQTARSGREAIEKVRKERPDIILTDIRMPGINGLEAVKEIKKIHNNIKFIIVSVYEYFEYAKQAVELGVIDYLTKPVNKARLVETLERVTRQLDEEKLRYDRELETKEKISRMVSIAEHSFIYSLLLSQQVNFSEYKALFDISSDTGYVFIIRFQSAGRQRDQFGDIALVRSAYTFFKDNLKYKYQCIVGPVMLDRVVGYIAQSVEDHYQQRVQAIAYLEELVTRVDGEFGIDIKVGIGGVRDHSGIMVSYQEAMRALDYTEGECVTHIDDVAPGLSDAGMEILAEERRLVSGVEKGDAQLCFSALTDIFTKYTDFFENESLHSRIIEIMIVARRIAFESGVAGDESIEYGEYIKQLLGCATKEQFEQMCMEKIRYIASRISKMKGKTIGIIVDKANRIIAERFSQELTLDGISKELYISPQYFSRLYKQEMGVNFIEQLTLVRMQHAKKLMEQGEFSVKEICYMSGYSDPNYFSRLFKKFEGVSPSAYHK
jgi:two-component system response regulator YesN